MDELHRYYSSIFPTRLSGPWTSMGKHSVAVQDHLAIDARILLTRGIERARRLLGREVFAPVSVRLSIDTGSKRSALLYSVLDHLGSVAGGVARLETSLGSGTVELHWVRLEFPGTPLLAIPHLLVTRVRMPPILRGFHGVIDRDLLSQWESFQYEGRRRRMTIRDTPGGFFDWLKG
jgi:hypothetical protein